MSPGHRGRKAQNPPYLLVVYVIKIREGLGDKIHKRRQFLWQKITAALTIPREVLKRKG